MSAEDAVAPVRRWVESIVVDLNLCPFARQELVSDRVRFVATDASDEERLLVALEAELELLNDDPSVETTLLIHPEVLQDFYDYNEFLSLADGLLVQMNLEGVYQVASFHPDYQFGGTEPNDAENHTNRSPYPALHILREESLERAIANHPGIDAVPEENIRLMNEMGADRMSELLSACFETGNKSKR